MYSSFAFADVYIFNFQLYSSNKCCKCHNTSAINDFLMYSLLLFFLCKIATGGHTKTPSLYKIWKLQLPNQITLIFHLLLYLLYFALASQIHEEEVELSSNVWDQLWNFDHSFYPVPYLDLKAVADQSKISSL